MARTILITFTLCVLSSLAFSLPLAQDSKSVQPTDSAHERRLMESSSELAIVTVLSHGEDSERDIKLVKSSDSVPSLDAVVALSSTDSAKSLRRTKRQVISAPGCPEGMIWFTKCMSYEEYLMLLEAAEVK